ncbi:hypothetical protein GOP47_0002317 [Adiantum capillus-veneris]|uniref:Aldehyde dehydrogenase n=1 Tax=Adiantum capillus-veneris TaxID=13818 RepID=A0A9D4VA58_ADICA|nr:hypothetical protein GOP47_0002317 [Adiantum capillus-veneris]
MAEEAIQETPSITQLAETTLSDARNTFRDGITRPFAWRITQVQALKNMIDEHEADICASLFDDLGKSSFEANYSELDPLRNTCDYFLKNIKKLMKPTSAALPWYMQSSAKATITPEPLGVVLVFSAWNFPLLLALDPLVAAVAAGNVVVLKPAELAKSTCTILKQLLPQYLDPRAVKVFEATRQECAMLLELKFDKIFYTGSPRIGRIIMEAAAKHLTPVTLELGGKNPVIVDSTADIFVVARRLAATKWVINSGQTCIAPDYVLVHSDVMSLFLEALKEALISFVTPLPPHESAYADEEPTDPQEQCFPHIINAESFARLQRLLEEVKDNINFTLGQAAEETLMIMPTIVVNPPPDCGLMQEEIFGPILLVLEVESTESAIDFVNSRPQPLALYLFTSNEELGKEVAQRTSSGSVVVNDVGVQFNVESFPFGGVGESGMGSYHGKFGFHTFSHMKPLLVTKTHGDDPTRYPPYTKKSKAILRACLRNQSILTVLLIKFGFKKPSKF